MLDRAIDMVAAIANSARLGEMGRQFEAGLPEVQPARLGRVSPAALDEVAPTLEIRDEAFLVQALERDAGGHAAGLKCSRDARFAQHKAVHQRAALEVIAQHRMDDAIERLVLKVVCFFLLRLHAHPIAAMALSIPVLH